MPTNIWGNTTWLFFHTLVETMDETKFDALKPLIINIIKDTCEHLPCPYCAADATKILAQAYTQNIKKKSHLVEFVRQFHNIVNVKLGNKTLTMVEAKNLHYATRRVLPIVNNLVQIYSIKHGMLKMMSYTMHKQAFLKRLVLNINNLQKI